VQEKNDLKATHSDGQMGSLCQRPSSRIGQRSMVGGLGWPKGATNTRWYEKSAQGERPLNHKEPQIAKRML
jgi:hypothetical protein